MNEFWFDLSILAYATATGFVSAGILSSFYQMVTAQPVKFALLGSSLPAWLITFVFFTFSGPFIIMRNAIRGRLVERQPASWLLGSLLIAGLWSVCSGLLVLDVALSVGSSFG